MDHAYTAIEALVAALIAVPVLGFFGAIIRHFAREEWIGKFNEGGNEYSEEIVIYNIMGWIIGKSKLTFDHDGKRLNARYRLRGALRHAIITAYFEGLDNAERGAFLIKFSPKKREYSGKYLLMDEDDGVTSVGYSWTKN